ncbi:MAG: hypothetical protein Kow0069_20050 [Promethearchaeota archaeon]
MPIDKEVSQEYLELLNRGVARELQVSVQYMLQHSKVEKLLRKVIPENILGETTTYEALAEVLKKFAIAEMKHLAAIMERIFILGGEATTKPSHVTIGNSLREFFALGVEAEKEALKLYREVIAKADQEGDRETWGLFQKIYEDEEEHLLVFQDYANIEDEPDLGETPESPWRSIFTEDYVALLNKALAAEISAIVQYTTQHEKASAQRLRSKRTALEVVRGTNKAEVLSALLKKVFMEEMEHMERIAERIYEVEREAVATADPLPQVGDGPDDWIKLDRDAEDYAIRLYRQVIAKATELGDVKTKRMFESILEQEEDHYWAFDDYLP